MLSVLFVSEEMNVHDYLQADNGDRPKHEENLWNSYL